MDQLIFASLSHTHYQYEVGMLKVPAYYIIITVTYDLFSLESISSLIAARVPTNKSHT